MRYMIFHAPRSGSNLLCSYINKTGCMGIASYENCGFYIGLGDSLKRDYKQKTEQYFAMQRTNDIEGCKISFEYLDELMRFCGEHFVYKLLNSVDVFFVLHRKDIISQAISWEIAKQTGVYSTLKKDKPQKLPVYNFDAITYTIGKIRAHYARFAVWESYHSDKPFIHIYHEDFLADKSLEMGRIASALGLIPSDSNYPQELQKIGVFVDKITPHIKKQANDTNKLWKERFYRELG